MEWWVLLAFLFCAFVLVLLTGMPIAFSFLIVCFIFASWLWGSPQVISQLVVSISQHMTRFALLPLPMFILMDEALFHSGIALNMIDTLDKWL